MFADENTEGLLYLCFPDSPEHFKVFVVNCICIGELYLYFPETFEQFIYCELYLYFPDCCEHLKYLG